MQIWKRVLAKSTAVYDALLRERGGRVAGSVGANPWVTTDSNCRTWLLAGQADGNTQNSQSVLLAYQLVYIWAFSSPLRVTDCRSGLRSEENYSQQELPQHILQPSWHRCEHICGKFNTSTLEVAFSRSKFLKSQSFDDFSVKYPII